ncbi:MULTISPECIES: NAD(P)-dependent alcohol dehydrogenase [unclassified Leptospira]|uniref:NAD(P)-dependent alcohol dehydrogenase n=1 Tax=unclassified Leptospira TaxID=2633828 RepID=UPI0002BE2F5C|nr:MULTISPECIES: NAD(P)-dependent alcohol dehydrogenase [unclassified Leptospira]EMK02113.1 oxidoreductase, zinc-binding dehydrogenase family protein [Leptospira sp. B5-022]MCR1793906.1 NAD(P)-dependent alcohol dehydrogenase [Leptospira sp. id769339]
MKAIVYENYGSPDVLQIKEVEKPNPKENEILIKVRTASVNAADWRMMRADPFLVRLYAGLFKPKKISILGADVAGTVEAVGRNITKFRPGDDVFGDVSASGFGAFAEYKCSKEDEFVLKPSNLSFEDVAALPLAGMTALHSIRDFGKVQSGQKVLINGASGGVGTFAIQLAKYFGAEVTAVCSTSKKDTAVSLGADHVIDYTKEDFTRNGKKYDLILGVNGFHSIFEYKTSLTPKGRYVMAGGGTAQLFQALLLGPFLSLFSDRKIVTASSQPNQKDLIFLSELLQSGKIKSVIDRRYTLDEVPEAVRYVEAGHAGGKVIIQVSS